ncbi:MAG: 50S ribosomal protein L13 [bacterium]|nr:50S ribosomal protein L13 [bacterium]
MIKRITHTIDATNKSAGRLATQIALLLRGKNKAEYLPHLDAGGAVCVINADKLKFTGKKYEQKEYHSYSGYPGGLKTKKIASLTPAQIITKAVRDMLPPTKHRVNLLKRLTIN